MKNDRVGTIFHSARARFFPMDMYYILYLFSIQHNSHSRTKRSLQPVSDVNHEKHLIEKHIYKYERQ